MERKASRENLLVFFLLITACVLCWGIEISGLSVYTFSDFIVSVTYIVVLIYVIRSWSFFSIPSLFILMVGFFGVFGIIFTLLGFWDYSHYSSGFIDYYWPDQTRVNVAFLYQILLTTAYFVFCIFRPGKNNGFLSTDIHWYDKYFLSIGKTLFLLTTPLALLNNIIEIVLVQAGGYASYYLGSSDSFFTSLLSPIVFLCNASFYLFCAGKPEKEDFNILAALFLVIALLDSLKGARGLLVIPVLFILYYYHRVYKVKLKPKHIFVLCIVAIAITSIYAYVREGFTPSSIGSLASQFFEQFALSSNSISIVAMYDQFHSSMNNYGYPYIFEPIVRVYDVLTHSAVYSAGQTQEMISFRNSLSHQLSYCMNPSWYLAGANTGSNMVAEMSQFGSIGVALLSFAFCMFIQFLEKKWGEQSFLGFMLYPLFSQILFAPRGSYFYDTYSLLRLLIMFCVFSLLAIWMRSRKLNRDLITDDGNRIRSVG